MMASNSKDTMHVVALRASASLYDLNICIYVYQRYVQVSAKRNATTFNGIRVLSPISVLRLCLSTVKKDIDIICKSIKSCYIFLCRHTHVSHAQQIHILPCKYGCQSGSTAASTRAAVFPAPTIAVRHYLGSSSSIRQKPGTLQMQIHVIQCNRQCQQKIISIKYQDSRKEQQQNGI